MSTTELRHDHVSGRLAIVAAGRATRPHTVRRAADEHDADTGQCPFCPGHEASTPPEVARIPHATEGGEPWRVRVFPNLFPIVGGDGTREGTTGAHEVVVLSPDHGRSFGALTDDEAVEVLTTLRDRAAVHIAAGHVYAVALVNHRRAAGASIAHPHAQLVALDFVPPEARAAEERASASVDDLLAGDLACARERDTVVIEQAAAAWCPFGAGSPFLVRVGDPTAGARFDQAGADLVEACAITLRDTLARLAVVLDDPPYNVTVPTAAADGTGPRHWYAEITPRLSVVAGFEQATGVLVNTVPPEDAAAMLRHGIAPT